jgi:hypothetical protein
LNELNEDQLKKYLDISRDSNTTQEEKQALLDELLEPIQEAVAEKMVEEEDFDDEQSD